MLVALLCSMPAGERRRRVTAALKESIWPTE
jgi:hypothetical protein